jgi:ankyrin repeat protein
LSLKEANILAASLAMMEIKLTNAVELDESIKARMISARSKREELYREWSKYAQMAQYYGSQTGGRTVGRHMELTLSPENARLRDQNNESAGEVREQINALNIQLFEACKSGDIEQALQAIEKGARIDERMTNPDSGKEEPPLHRAAKYAHKNDKILTILAALAFTGADVNANNNKGESPLYAAADRAYLSNPKVLITLLEYGANPLEINSKEGSLRSILAKQNRENMIQALEANKLLSKSELRWQKPLIVPGLQAAIERGDTDFIYSKLEAFELGVDKLYIFKEGDISQIRTMLYWAAHRGIEGAVDFLLGMGADVNGCDKKQENRPPLFTAAKHGWLDIVANLVRHGADVNYAGDQGWTALHVAVKSFQESTARYLIAQGARVYARKADGYTPLDIAKYKQSARLISLLENADLGHWLEKIVEVEKKQQDDIIGTNTSLQATQMQTNQELATIRQRIVDLQRASLDRKALKLNEVHNLAHVLATRLNAVATATPTEENKQLQNLNERLLMIEVAMARFATYEPMLVEYEQKFKDKETIRHLGPKEFEYVRTYCNALNGALTAALSISSGFVAVQAQGGVGTASTATNTLGMINDGVQFAGTAASFAGTLAQFANVVPMVGGAISMGLSLIKMACDQYGEKKANEWLNNLLLFAGPNPADWYDFVESVAIEIVTAKQGTILSLAVNPTVGWKAKVVDCFRKFVDAFSTDPKRTVVEKYAMEDAAEALHAIFERSTPINISSDRSACNVMLAMLAKVAGTLSQQIPSLQAGHFAQPLAIQTANAAQQGVGQASSASLLSLPLPQTPLLAGSSSGHDLAAFGVKMVEMHKRIDLLEEQLVAARITVDTSNLNQGAFSWAHHLRPRPARATADLTAAQALDP